MSDKPIITVGTTTLKLQTGLRPTDQQWCELAHIRAFSTAGTDITDQVQIDAQQVAFDQEGTYPVQAFISDPTTHKIAGQMFQVQLISLEMPTTAAPAPEPKAVEKPSVEPSPKKAPFKDIIEEPIRPKVSAQPKTTEKTSKDKAQKSHRHFMWTVLTLVLGILLMWLLIYIFSGGNNNTSTSSTQSTPTTAVESSSTPTETTTESTGDKLNTLLQKIEALF